jgi:hypothetical protein
VLINPGTSVDTMESHVRIMWPEPVAEGGVAMEISGAPIPPGENVIWMRQMAEGRFAVRINGGPPIPCKSNREIAQATAEGWFEHLVKGMGGGRIGIKAHHLKLVFVIGFVPICYACAVVASVLRGY